MAQYTFFHNPMSRGQIAHWALHETGADFAPVIVEWDHKPEALLAANPMGKIPTVIHHAPNGNGDGDRVITEAAAICHYLAEMHPQAALLPNDAEKAPYFRWLFFAAGPVEIAITAQALGFETPPDKQRMAGWGSVERTIDTLESHFKSSDFVCGGRFTMADVYVGSAIDWGTMFGAIDARPAFTAYADRFRGRGAYQAAKAIDNAMIADRNKEKQS